MPRIVSDGIIARLPENSITTEQIVPVAVAYHSQPRRIFRAVTVDVKFSLNYNR